MNCDLPIKTWLATAAVLAMTSPTLAQTQSTRSRALPLEARTALAAEEAEVTELTLSVGESRVLSAPGVSRVAVGSGKVMTASTIDGKDVLVFGNAPGSSSLLVWGDTGQLKRYKLHVTAGDTQQLSKDISRFLSHIPNIRTATIGDTVVVEGDQLADADLLKIEELAKRYPQIVNFTNRQGWEKMILMDVKVVEFPTNELRELGMKWGAAGGAAVGALGSLGRVGSPDGLAVNIPTDSKIGLPIVNPNAPTGSVPLPSGLRILSALNAGLNASLRLMAQEGKASILAQPQLSARNGSKATFLAGGEFPFTVSSITGQTVVFKPYGIKLEIVPKVDRNGMVRAVIESEVSAIDGSVVSSAGPALTTRKTSTEFNVRNGETLVLSGLLTRKNSVSIDKVPFLGDLPFVGALFRSKRVQNDETELVVFVTPTIVDADTPELRQKVQAAGQRLQSDTGKEPFLPRVTPRSNDAPAAMPGVPAALPSKAPLPVVLPNDAPSPAPHAAVSVEPEQALEASWAEVALDDLVIPRAMLARHKLTVQDSRSAKVLLSTFKPKMPPRWGVPVMQTEARATLTDRLQPTEARDTIAMATTGWRP